VTDGHGIRSPRVRVLRALARDRSARAETSTCLLEGPRVIAAALDRGARLREVWYGWGARHAFPDLSARLDAAGIEQHSLREGALEKIGTTRTPQPVLGVAEWRPVEPDAAFGDGFTVVAADVTDPGNLGTILRSAEAAGAEAVVVTDAGVDPRSPKVVRSSAGAAFGVPVAVVADVATALVAARARGARCHGAVAHGGAAPDALDLAHRSAIVVGNEAHGLPADVVAGLDDTVTIPMAGVTESLNVAMATTVLCFEAARQRSAVRP